MNEKIIQAKAPELSVSCWFNAPEQISLNALHGKTVVLLAFQMLCPGCVAHALPQAKRIRQAFSLDQLEVIGLHTVFEHHNAMTPVSLEAFLHEYQISFPVGVDKALGGSNIPRTMTLYEMEGTPSLILIDQQGRKRKQYFGQVSDIMIGAEISTLLVEGNQSNFLDFSYETGNTCHLVG